MISFRGPSSQKGKGTLMPTATFEACKLLMKQKKTFKRQTNSREEVQEIRITMIKTKLILG